MFLFLFLLAAEGVHCFQEKNYHEFLNLQNIIFNGNNNTKMENSQVFSLRNQVSAQVNFFKKFITVVTDKLSNDSQCFNLISFIILFPYILSTLGSIVKDNFSSFARI